MLSGEAILLWLSNHPAFEQDLSPEGPQLAVGCTLA